MRDGRALTPPGRPPDARSSLKGSDRSVPSGADSGPDLDADLSVIRGSVDDLGVWTGIWEARREPDAFARRCASDAIDAVDTALAALHRIRARLIGRSARPTMPRLPAWTLCSPGCATTPGRDLEPSRTRDPRHHRPETLRRKEPVMSTITGGGDGDPR